MIKKFTIIILGLFLGVVCGYLIVSNRSVEPEKIIEKHQVMGFLPYWLTDKADKDYSKYLTTLTYFGLTISSDGNIEKFTKPTESEPGWHALNSGKMDIFFNQAKKNNIKLSLLVFMSNEDSIGELISNPDLHARNLVEEVAPIMKKYGFSDLNLDIESVSDASESARINFTAFVSAVKKNIDQKDLGTLTIDASPTVLIKKYLINLSEVEKLVDNVVLMTYDYHYQGSYVTGPVSPVGGAKFDSEFDSETAINEALKIMTKEKIFLGVPLYGYEWETLAEIPRSAVIPGTGLVASNRRVEELLKTCVNCHVQLDNYAKESYLIYKDENTGTFHQFFYPDINATKAKIMLANKFQIGGMALWALGYEGNTILSPLLDYRHQK